MTFIDFAHTINSRHLNEMKKLEGDKNRRQIKKERQLKLLAEIRVLHISRR